MNKPLSMLTLAALTAVAAPGASTPTTIIAEAYSPGRGYQRAGRRVPTDRARWPSSRQTGAMAGPPGAGGSDGERIDG